MFFRLLRSKRGVGMEIAIVMMLTVFGFCSIMTTVALLQNDRNKKTSESFPSYFEPDQIGEEFLSVSRQNGSVPHDFHSPLDKYITEVNGTTLSVYENVDEQKGKLLLTVELKKENGVFVPKTWIKKTK